jgi:hypothetical protein
MYVAQLVPVQEKATMNNILILRQKNSEHLKKLKKTENNELHYRTKAMPLF